MNRKILAACAAVAAAAVTLTAAAGCGRNDGDGTGLPGLSPAVAKPLKDQPWFTQHFGEPLLAATNVTPKTIEQAHDIRGTVLPQDGARLDGPVMWQRVRCDALPFSTTDGPAKMRADTVYGGYARTPLGAALAAYQMASFGGTIGNTDAVPQIIAPADRDRLVSQIPEMKESKFKDDPGCLPRQKKLTRPARWKADPVSDTVTRVEFWWPPLPGESQGYSIDYSVTWQEGDWYLTEQAASDVLMIGKKMPRQPQYTAEPVGWSQW
ncbi:hypothetical protein IU443_28080 [Nocardia farcinica]|uniref:DUF8175 domain-containing protein n=1 Tax=Nocardia farcinica TaxID=37329 RepID=A0A449G5Q0_NOCFR|nr:hypothetical protein [Nocardia farcinica]MBF6393790.1 hypothetical protein [Nocardia farcinica]MBF6411250.1 hypothetical protein [Nocardia farcinica]MCZ9330281.1 hypothetical protein [Nocardia farcinica]UEX26203.1 hypothetical protein LMJ57_30090 [Nocardia farcinica]VFA96231.1 Uncharacterised protein [Nocardia farcinica]